MVEEEEEPKEGILFPYYQRYFEFFQTSTRFTEIHKKFFMSIRSLKSKLDNWNSATGRIKKNS